MKPLASTLLSTMLVLFLLCGCVVSAPDSRSINLNRTATPSHMLPASLDDLLPTPRPAGSAYFSPTPDAPHTLPTLRTEDVQYTVQTGDYLSLIASRYNLPLAAIMTANPDMNPEILEPGQVLLIPAPRPAPANSDFKIIPDSELVYGPASATLDLSSFLVEHPGYLSNYSEEVEGQTLSGGEIVKRAAYEYSVNPRLLLALLEYQSGWVTQSIPNWDEGITYPIGRMEFTRSGLYKQLCWAADTLNRAYYLYQIDALPYAVLGDNSLIMLSTLINPGTAAVQTLMAQLYVSAGYQEAISENGVYATYIDLFGMPPFDLAVEPLLPAGLAQPSLTLPFESGATWSYTGGPHGGWGSGSAWAALDFAPPSDQFNCYTSNEWEVAAADGLIVRSKDGAVVLDLDGDGLEQTGWTLLYMHVESRDRVKAGTYVKAGDRIGHPSCEGGYSNGTHLHFARRYNGEWISADGNLPFNLDGWVSSGQGAEYDGFLTKNDLVLTAWEGRIAENQIQR